MTGRRQSRSPNSAPRTSLTSPLDVGWLRIGGAGRLGLTMAPGRNQRGAFTGHVWARDLKLDVERLAGHHGVGTLVCLLGDDELRRLGIPDYSDVVRAYGIELLRLPIIDGDIPRDREAVDSLVQAVLDRLDAERCVVIHCAGGLGRAGTIGGCCLRALGFGPEDVFERLAMARGPRCPENAAQRQFIASFAPGGHTQ